MPPELLLVGRVFGLLNGLSKTLQAKTNMLVAFAQLADEMEAAKASAAASPSTNGAQRCGASHAESARGVAAS